MIKTSAWEMVIAMRLFYFKSFCACVVHSGSWGFKYSKIIQKTPVSMILTGVFFVIYYTTVRKRKYKFVQRLKKDIRNIKLRTEIIIAVNEVSK